MMLKGCVQCNPFTAEKILPRARHQPGTAGTFGQRLNTELQRLFPRQGKDKELRQYQLSIWSRSSEGQAAFLEDCNVG